MNEDSKGKKDDKDKLDWSLIPLWIFEAGEIEERYKEITEPLWSRDTVISTEEVARLLWGYFCASEKHRMAGRHLQRETQLCYAISACVLYIQNSFWSQIPREDVNFYDALATVIPVMAFGAEKYGRFNWIHVEQERYVSAAFRHLLDLRSGKTIDEESGFMTTRHILANLIILLALSSL